MKNNEYAIVDIETTGGNATHSRITEIAIVIYDGTQIIDRWESLVNPQKFIPPAIFALTGIDNELVKNAPTFEEISNKVFDMLDNRIFVAHNVNFDYSFVRHELETATVAFLPSVILEISFFSSAFCAQLKMEMSRKSMVIFFILKLNVLESSL